VIRILVPDFAVQKGEQKDRVVHKYLARFQSVSISPRFLDLAELRQYGPRGFKARGVQRSRAASVEIMSDARKNGDHDKQQTSEAALSARLQRLKQSLGHARDQAGRTSGASGADPATTASGYARGFRLSSELVAGVVVGAGLGWLIDRWLGISPWGLIIFLLLGFAAGVLNVMRSAGLVAGTALDNSTRGRREK
jgi:ATP synthase protein I